MQIGPVCIESTMEENGESNKLIKSSYRDKKQAYPGTACEVTKSISTKDAVSEIAFSLVFG